MEVHKNICPKFTTRVITAACQKLIKRFFEINDSLKLNIAQQNGAIDISPWLLLLILIFGVNLQRPFVMDNSAARRDENDF